MTTGMLRHGAAVAHTAELTLRQPEPVPMQYCFSRGEFSTASRWRRQHLIRNAEVVEMMERAGAGLDSEVRVRASQVVY
ncbi:MAG: hypothetical protein ABJB74_03220 [Gemmatimonas sp.]